MAIETQPSRAQGSGGGRPAGEPEPAPLVAAARRSTPRSSAPSSATCSATCWATTWPARPAPPASTRTSRCPTPRTGRSCSATCWRSWAGWPGSACSTTSSARCSAARRRARRRLPEQRGSGLAKYFRYALDHKVVGIQYLVGMIIYFCTAGLFAMAIRTELLSPVRPRLHLAGLRGDRRRARHDDDDADDLGHPRPVRQLPGPAHDRRQAGRLPPGRGAVVLADADGVPDPAVGPAARRLPVRLDRVRAAVDPVHRRR